MTETDDDLVDDPFIKGEKTKRWASKIHPAFRFGEAVSRRFAADEAKAAAK
jgi:hypothetical protein